MPNEMCNICGNSVKGGSGRFVNRIPDFNTMNERRELGRKYPKGDYICAFCMDEFDSVAGVLY